MHVERDQKHEPRSSLRERGKKDTGNDEKKKGGAREGKHDPRRCGLPRSTTASGPDRGSRRRDHETGWERRRRDHEVRRK